MRKHELTINGLTKSAARQLGQAYFSLAESMDTIDDLSADNAAASREFAKLSMEASGLRTANAGLKKYIKRLEDGKKPDEPTDAEIAGEEPDVPSEKIMQSIYEHLECADDHA